MNPWTLCHYQVRQIGKQINVENKNIFEQLHLHLLQEKTKNSNKKKPSKLSLKTNRTYQQRKQTSFIIDTNIKFQQQPINKSHIITVPTIPIKMHFRANQTYLPQKPQNQKQLILKKLNSFQVNPSSPVSPFRAPKPSNIKINYINPQKKWQNIPKNKTLLPPQIITFKHLKRLNTMPQKGQQISLSQQPNNQQIKKVWATKSMREPQVKTNQIINKTKKLQDIQWKSVQSQLDDEQIRDQFSVLASKADDDIDFTHQIWANSNIGEHLAKSQAQTTSL